MPIVIIMYHISIITVIFGVSVRLCAEPWVCIEKHKTNIVHRAALFKNVQYIFSITQPLMFIHVIMNLDPIMIVFSGHSTVLF